MKARQRYAGRALVPFVLALLGGVPVEAWAQELSQGIASWAEATVGRKSGRWVGQRVLGALPTARPASVAVLDSERWSLRVHLTGAVNAARLALLQDVLTRAEHTTALLEASGLFAPRAELSPGHAARRDLYLVDRGFSGAARDETVVVSVLYASSSFALVAVRAPANMRDACVAEALIAAELLELDPAESEVVREASARYFAELVTGDRCAALPASTPFTRDDQGVLHDPDKLARWLFGLAERQDRNRGVFLENMWQFARQQTWEGAGLRGSPDLFEAIAKALELSQDKLEQVGGELANASALRRFDGTLRDQPKRVLFSRLPAHLPASAPLDVLDSSYQWIDLEGGHANARLTIWARGEYGVRWVLSATRLDAYGRELGTVNAPVHSSPDTELSLELDGETHFVLASVTNMGDGLPDPDVAANPAHARSVRLIVARGD